MHDVTHVPLFLLIYSLTSLSWYNGSINQTRGVAQMSEQEKRNNTRYASRVPVRFMHDGFDGMMVDASKNGAMVLVESATAIRVGTPVSFKVYLDGVLPPAIQSKKQNFFDKWMCKKTPSEAIVPADKGIHINGRVVRHSTEKGQIAMGVRIENLDLDGLHQWLNFIGQLKQTHQVLPFGTANKHLAPESEPAPGFILRFQKMAYLKNFLPKSPSGSFFIPTEKKTDENKKIKLTIVHPNQDKSLELIGCVQSHASKANDEDKEGLLCSFASQTDDIIARINQFLDEPIYPIHMDAAATG